MPLELKLFLKEPWSELMFDLVRELWPFLDFWISWLYGDAASLDKIPSIVLIMLFEL